MRYLFLAGILILILFTANAQNSFVLNSHKEFNSADSSKLFLRFENLNFLKTKEYDSYFIKGETLLGYLAAPKFIYYPSSKVRIEGGVRFQKYFGRDGFSGTQPVFSLIYKPGSRHTIIMGTLNQNGNHQLSEPMMNSEFYFKKNAENGLQYQYNGNRFQLDTWLNWKQFIFEDDPFKEKFNLGGYVNLFITKNTSKNVLSMPFEILLAHEGGQIDTSPEKVLTMINIASGLKWEHKTSSCTVKSWYIKMAAYMFTNSLSKRSYIFKNGFALYPQIGFKTNKSSVSFGYYTPYHFSSLNASMIFNSNLHSAGKYFRERNNLITAGCNFNKNIAKGINLCFEANAFYRFNNHRLHYDFAFYISSNLDFFITRLKGNQ